MTKDDLPKDPTEIEYQPDAETAAFDAKGAAEYTADDIQVLTPMRRGLLGANNLNLELQRLINPAVKTVQRGASTLGEGDRVMQMRNNYELGVFNGDVGRVRSIDIEEETLSVAVSAVNDAPVVSSAISDVNVDEDAANEIIELAFAFEDAEDDHREHDR